MRLAAIALLILWPATLHTEVYQDCGGFQDYGERLEFKRLLRKHGLDKDVSVVWKDQGGWYFERNGQRCPFK